jgi:DNA-binding NarL/FixJ family response regulator
VVVTDFQLGNTINGPALVETIRAEFPKTRTVVVSAITMRKQVEQAAAAGANAFLEKGVMQSFVQQLYDLIQCPTDLLPPIDAYACGG